MWDTWGSKTLEGLIERHKKVNAYLKANSRRKGSQSVCVCVDGFADAGGKVMHSSTKLCSRLCSPAAGTLVAHVGPLSQKPRVISLICRTNFCWMCIWRLRNG